MLRWIEEHRFHRLDFVIGLRAARRILLSGSRRQRTSRRLLALLGKLLPTEIAADEPVTHEVVLKWMTPEMAKARGLVGPPWIGAWVRQGRV
jgi:hypothetical protein